MYRWAFSLVAVLVFVFAFASSVRAQESEADAGTPEAGREAVLSTEFRRLIEEKDFKQALVVGQQLLEIRKQRFETEASAEHGAELASTQRGLGYCYSSLRQFDKALPLSLSALEISRKFFSLEKYPQGHPALSSALYDSAVAFRSAGQWARAVPLFEEFVELQELLYPDSRYPNGHPWRMTAWDNLAKAYDETERNVQAKLAYEKSMEIAERLFPASRYPQGHQYLLILHGNMGGILRDVGEYGRAVQSYQRSAEMARAIFPKEKFPQGHPLLMLALTNLASTLNDLGDHARALAVAEEAHAMALNTFGPKRFPQGHPRLTLTLQLLGAIHANLGDTDRGIAIQRQNVKIRRSLMSEQEQRTSLNLALALNNLGNILMASRPDEAREVLEEALVICQRRYSREAFPNGHRHLALAHQNLARLSAMQGKFDVAAELLDKAEQEFARYYPQSRFPEPHLDLATHYGIRGQVDFRKGDAEGAFGNYLKAARIENDHVSGLSAWLSEAEALNMIQDYARSPNDLISAAVRSSGPTAEVYEAIWFRRGFVQRMSWLRQQQLAQALGAEHRQLYAQYVDVRRQISQLVLATAGDEVASTERRTRIAQLTRGKEDFERQLQTVLPDLTELWKDQARLRVEDLKERLRPDEVFVDYLRYEFRREDTQREQRYVAFVVTRREVTLVPLSTAEKIDALVRGWRKHIEEERTSAIAKQIREEVWAPVEAVFPQNIQTVYICPDGSLAGVPWVAIPGQQEGTVLLERYLMTVVPSGHQLLKPHGEVDPAKENVLIVGNVDYGATGTTEDEKHSWPLLPGTEEEIGAVSALAGERSQQLLEQNAASVAEVLAELPNATTAHFATHGYFAAPKFRSVLLSRYASDMQGRSEEISLVRSPLALSALVLAPANQQEQSMMLTGESVAGLPLVNLNLVVLSACETGLGEVADGEGVFGLQRAFHIAGTDNVIASLWRVDDQSTTALMRLFYYNMWKLKKQPREALREAQLAIYRHPAQINQLASADRGPAFAKVVKLVSPANPTRPRKLPVRRWAGFLCSGIGTNGETP